MDEKDAEHYVARHTLSLFGTQSTASATTDNTYVVIDGFYIILVWHGNVWNHLLHQFITRSSMQNERHTLLLA
jgi:hypothetical protein